MSKELKKLKTTHVTGPTNHSSQSINWICHLSVRHNLLRFQMLLIMLLLCCLLLLLQSWP